MMRGAIAAACAAVIMGLASPGAFACASVAAGRAATEQQHQVFALLVASPAPVASVEAQTSTRPACPEATTVRPVGERVTAWRAPSGPAPSRAPPAALV
jgi:hypothetical protein